MVAEDARQYIANPDVSCREEWPDGALLFNPDTDQVLVINSTGLMIWQALERPRTLAEVVAVLQERCVNVPADQVGADVREFVETMVGKGFIGIYGGIVP